MKSASKRIVGILLAAGKGTRFGNAKLLAPLAEPSHGVSGGAALGVAAAMHLMAALNEVVAVVRPGDVLLQQALAETGARTVVCERADEGMGASLACAVAECADADGWLVALADMPWIAPATIAAVADALGDGAEIAAPSYRGERGHPVGFARPYGALLRELTGDEGARSLLAARRWALRLVEVDDAGVLLDVDRPEDLRKQQ
ncbi:MAG: nucleotidyltransferase family protein [Burkholderiales bacterium]|nr:nucleotidyltransferase family protein [Burkholderiales bacterium]